MMYVKQIHPYEFFHELFSLERDEKHQQEEIVSETYNEVQQTQTNPTQFNLMSFFMNYLVWRETRDISRKKLSLKWIIKYNKPNPMSYFMNYLVWRETREINRKKSFLKRIMKYNKLNPTQPNSMSSSWII